MKLSPHPVTWRLKGLVLALVVLPALASGVAAEDTQPKPEEGFGGLSALAEAFEQIGDWDQQYEPIAEATKRLWEQNEWNDEADIYARDSLLEVARIPPWELSRRIDKLTTLSEERYDLTPRQAQAFRRRAVHDVSRFMFRHAGVILKQTREMIGARGAGEPLTAEQVARWTRENEPLMQDAKHVFAEFLDDFEGTMTPEQKELLARDRRSADKLLRYVDEQRAQWAEGKWDPTQWGMQDNPAQRQSNSKNPGQARRQGSLAQVTRWKDYDPKTWITYLRHFEQKYALDPGQTTAAKSIHAETFERAEAYMHSRAAELAVVPEDERDTHPAFAPVRALFSELQGRFDALLTKQQRAAQEP